MLLPRCFMHYLLTSVAADSFIDCGNPVISRSAVCFVEQVCWQGFSLLMKSCTIFLERSVGNSSILQPCLFCGTMRFNVLFSSVHQTMQLYHFFVRVSAFQD